MIPLRQSESTAEILQLIDSNKKKAYNIICSNTFRVYFQRMAIRPHLRARD